MREQARFARSTEIALLVTYINIICALLDLVGSGHNGCAT